MPDTEIIQSILQGNHQDYKLIVDKYQSNVFRTAIGFVHHKEDAEDITQDCFIKAFQSLSSFSGKAAFSTWLYRIAVNTSVNFLRSKKRKNFWIELTSSLNISSKEKECDDKLLQDEQQHLVQKALDTLPEKQCVAIVLSKYEELPQREIAGIMHITEGAVEQLIIRAKNNLQK